MRMTAEFVEMLNKLQTGELKIGKLQFDPEKQRYDFTLEASSPPQEDEPTYYKLDNPHQVFFYEQEFYMFSNFSAFRLKWQGVDFDTSEHAYHFQKFDYHPEIEPDTTSRVLKSIRSNIRNAISAHEAFKFAERNKWRDSYWGWGPDRKGQNVLGRLWMRVREELRNGDIDF